MNENKIFLVSFRNGEGKIKSVPCTYVSFSECSNQWISYCSRCNFELVGIIEAEYHEDSDRNYYCPITYPIY